MSNNIPEDTHDKLVKAFIEYSNANLRFETQGFLKSAVVSRQALLEISRLVKLRRQEIFEKRVALHGHKRKGIAATAPSERRQRKLDRQNQKQQATDQEDNN
jgi:hypothetical protein